MKCDIDFSLFESPVRAYGNVTGELELESLPTAGAVVELLHGMLALRVQQVNYVNGRPVIMFDDVVAESPNHAALLAQRLERDAGLFCPHYHQP